MANLKKLGTAIDEKKQLAQVVLTFIQTQECGAEYSETIALHCQPRRQCFQETRHIRSITRHIGAWGGTLRSDSHRQAKMPISN